MFLNTLDLNCQPKKPAIAVCELQYISWW